MLFIICITLAAICKAVADTLYHHYGTSIFSNYNEKWWNPNESWKHAKFFPYTKYRVDAWHLANSGMISFFLAAGVWNDLNVYKGLEFIGAGVLFIVVFNLF
ncbi:MAG TPA: hypothetical protein VD794_10210, partial [Flavisolibacter sp.]|nr:hypothetical protein [Flavisolibacter sp.]